MNFTVTMDDYRGRIIRDGLFAPFNRWMEAEGLAGESIIEMTLGEGNVVCRCYKRDEDGRYIVHGDQAEVVTRVFPVRSLPPAGVFA